jgi:hypothetical protein
MAEGVTPAVEHLPTMWKFKSQYWPSNSKKKNKIKICGFQPHARNSTVNGPSASQKWLVTTLSQGWS